MPEGKGSPYLWVGIISLKRKWKLLDRRKHPFGVIFILTLYSVLFTGNSSLWGETLNNQKAKKWRNCMVSFGVESVPCNSVIQI